MKREGIPSNEDNGITKRSLLRNGATAVFVGAFGTTAFSGRAAACDFCPRSPGYWANHWHDNFGDSLEIPMASDYRDPSEFSKAEIQDLLTAPTFGDKVNIMAKQYVATYLNLWLRPASGEDEDCANKPVYVEGIGMVQWEHVKNAAQHWLDFYEWDGTIHNGCETWDHMQEVEAESGEVEVNGEVLKDALDAFNNNQFDELDCDCNCSGDGHNAPDGDGNGDSNETENKREGEQDRKDDKEHENENGRVTERDEKTKNDRNRENKHGKKIGHEKGKGNGKEGKRGNGGKN